MYEVYLDGKILYYPGDKINALVSAVLDRKLNESGTFKITVPPTNPLFDSFQKRISEVKILENGKEIWNGEVRGEKGNLKKEKMIEVVGELAYLRSSSQPQKVYENYNTLQAFTAVLNEHNARVEERKQFVVGIVTVDNISTTWITNYEQTLDYLRSEMCTKLNGYLRIRKENGIRYLDLVKLEDYGKTCNQPIEFGKNMLDYASNITADSIVTVIRPLGSKLDNSVVEGLDSYVTIESVNDGKDYIENADAINSGIGKVWKTVHFNVLSDPAAVKTAGENWLQANQFENMVLSVTAVDLSAIKVNIDSFELGDRTRVKAKPFGMDKWSYITEKKIDLLNPETKNNITIGESVKKSFTQMNNSTQNDIKDLIPEQTIILELAKKNASDIIKTATEGFIHIVYNEAGNPKELLIMDTDDINTAKKVWRWNINGLGYSKTGYNGTYGIAMTMDGAIVADFITSGTMYADRIKGGTLRLGGASNTNGILEVCDKDGKVVGKWDKDGITLPSGTKIAWENVTNQPTIPSKTSQLTNDSYYQTATSIKNTVITKDYIETLKVKAGSVDAENITGTKISGKTINGGEIIMQGSDGSLFHVYNNSNVDITGLVTILATYLSDEWTNKEVGILFQHQSRLGDIYDGTFIGLNKVKTDSVETTNLKSKYLNTGSDGLKVTGRTNMDILTASSMTSDNMQVKSNAWDKYYAPALVSSQNEVCFHWTGTRLGVYVDNTNVGYVNLTA